jgi:hypothetical protein
MTITPSDLASLEDHNDRSRWHLKKEVQVGHIITTLTVLFGLIWYAAKIEQRVAMVETHIEQRDDAINKQIAAQREYLQAQDVNAMQTIINLRSQLDKIEGKLDRLIEKRPK